jgi:cell division protein FtsB
MTIEEQIVFNLLNQTLKEKRDEVDKLRAKNTELYRTNRLLQESNSSLLTELRQVRKERDLNIAFRG